jgi:hypothetical protein
MVYFSLFTRFEVVCVTSFIPLNIISNNLPGTWIFLEKLGHELSNNLFLP